MELKPCPFCGSDDLHLIDGDQAYIACKCGAKGRPTRRRVVVPFKDRITKSQEYIKAAYGDAIEADHQRVIEAAVNAWNRRV